MFRQPKPAPLLTGNNIASLCRPFRATVNEMTGPLTCGAVPQRDNRGSRRRDEPTQESDKTYTSVPPHGEDRHD
jgi:hypothetical protein